MSEYWQTFIEKYIRPWDTSFVTKSTTEIYILLIISVPLSLILYLLFSKGNHKTLVDLGHGHKWLIK
jgi:hypothetical protein